MKKEELQFHLEQPKEIFYDNGILYIAYDKEREDELNLVLDPLKALFKEDGNYLFVKRNGRYRVDLSIHKHNREPLLEFKEISCPNLAYRDIIEKAATKELVTINFFIYDKDVMLKIINGIQLLGREILKIPVEGSFSIKSLDEPTISNNRLC